jgi:hypothetical protein
MGEHMRGTRVKSFRFKLVNDYLYNEIFNNFSDLGGTYKIVSMNLNEDRPFVVDRFLKRDERGILYIGKANRFTNRVVELKKSIIMKYKTASHDFGIKFNTILEYHYKTELLNPENLWVELTEHQYPDKLEMEEIANYLKEFGELPPFNSVSSKI